LSIFSSASAGRCQLEGDWLVVAECCSEMTINEFQKLIEDIYYHKDSARGLPSTFMWLIEEVGELSQALRSSNPDELAEEFADVLAWLATTASIAGIDLDEAAQKYANGCPKCGHTPCDCPEPAGYNPGQQQAQ